MIYYNEAPKLDVEVENEQTTAAKYPVWQKIHARYEMPAYSRKLVSLYPSSYHRLGLATVESQIDTGRYFVLYFSNSKFSSLYSVLSI